MKRFLALCLSLFMFCGMFAACGDGQETPDGGEGQQGQGTNGGEEKLAAEQVINFVASEPNILDVARFLGIADRNVFYNTLECLVRIDGGVVKEAGAESYEISEDGLTYTFHLRENYWSDGQKVTAEDYATALRRQADPKNAFAFANSYYAIENFEDIFKGEKDVSELGVEVVDDSTLVLHLSRVDTSLLSTAQFFPDRADLAEKYGDSYGTEADKTPSCGPFVLSEWTHNSSLVYTKNEKYWNAENVRLEKANGSVIDDVNAQYASFENGSVDYLTVSDMDYINKFEGNADMVKDEYATGRTVMVVFNCQDSVFSNTKIRQAFSLAMDRDILSEVIAAGLGQPAFGLIPDVCSVGSLNFRAEAEEPLLEIKEANPDPKALLIEGMEEQGLGSDPSKLTVTFSWGGTTAQARTYAELYQSMWQEALGVVIELEFNDSPTHMNNLNSGDYQFGTCSWGANLEPQFQLSRWANAKGGQSHWVNEEYNALVAKASATVDENERLKTYAEAEKLIVQEAAIAPAYYGRTCRFLYSDIAGLAGKNTMDETGLMTIYVLEK